MNLKFAFHFFHYSKKCQKKRLILNSQSLINNILQNTINNTMSIEEAIDSYYIINELFKEEKNPFQFEHIYKWIDSLFTCENLINKQSLLNQGLAVFFVFGGTVFLRFFTLYPKVPSFFPRRKYSPWE